MTRFHTYARVCVCYASYACHVYIVACRTCPRATAFPNPSRDTLAFEHYFASRAALEWWNRGDDGGCNVSVRGSMIGLRGFLVSA